MHIEFLGAEELFRQLVDSCSEIKDEPQRELRPRFECRISAATGVVQERSACSITAQTQLALEVRCL